MSLSFITSVVLLLQDAQENASAVRKADRQLQAQREEYSSLRKIALARWPFTGAVVILGFTAARWKSLLKLYPEVRLHDDDDLAIHDGVVEYTPKEQDTTPLVHRIEPEDDDYRDFKGFVNEICSFTITLNDQSDLARCEVNKWPDDIEIGSDSDQVKMTFRPLGLYMGDLDRAKVRVHLETENPKDAPVSITLLSLDRHLLFLNQPIIPQWRKGSREIQGTFREPIQINYLESGPQRLEVDFPGILPQAQ